MTRLLTILAFACATAALLVPFAGRAGLIRVANDVTGMAGLALILGIWAVLLGGGTLLGALAWRCAPKSKSARAAFLVNGGLLAAFVGLLIYLRA